MTLLTPTQLKTAANTNLVTHFSWVQHQTTGMHIIENPNLVLVDSGLPCDTYNAVCRAQLIPETAANQIQQAIDYFARANRPFSWWLNPGDQPENLGQLLMDAGLQPAETELAMAADLSQLQISDQPPADLQIHRVRTAAQLQDFAHIVAANWNPPDVQVLRFYELAAPLLLKPDCPLWFYVGYLDSIPVASSELTVGGGVVGLYNICTLESYRRRGFGMALTLQPLLDARSQGHNTAILQASDAGSRIYARVGFETFGHITEYKPPATNPIRL